MEYSNLINNLHSSKTGREEAGRSKRNRPRRGEASLQRKLGRRELKGTFLIDDQDDIERHRLDNIGIVREGGRDEF